MYACLCLFPCTCAISLQISFCNLHNGYTSALVVYLRAYGMRAFACVCVFVCVCTCVYVFVYPYVYVYVCVCLCVYMRAIITMSLHDFTSHAIATLHREYTTYYRCVFTYTLRAFVFAWVCTFVGHIVTIPLFGFTSNIVVKLHSECTYTLVAYIRIDFVRARAYARVCVRVYICVCMCVCVCVCVYV